MRETYTLSPRCTLHVKLSVNLAQREAILHYINSRKGFECLLLWYNERWKWIYTVIQNCTDIKQTTIATAPFKVDSYEKENRETNLNYYDNIQCDVDSILTKTQVSLDLII